MSRNGDGDQGGRSGSRNRGSCRDIAAPGDSEHLVLDVDSIAPEAACTSLQLHLQLTPQTFPAHWNAAQAIAGVQVALAANSPFLLGHRLWAETRVPLFEQAGFPPGVVNVVTGYGADAGDALVRHPRVAKLSFTGSTATGSRIAATCGSRFVPVTLELGGKSANIVCDDADLDLAAAGVLWGTFFHNGQVCESGTRALVSRKIYDEFVGMLVERAGKIVIGDNMDMNTDLGPLVAPYGCDSDVEATLPIIEKYDLTFG